MLQEEKLYLKESNVGLLSTGLVSHSETGHHWDWMRSQSTPTKHVCSSGATSDE